MAGTFGIHGGNKTAHTVLVRKPEGINGNMYLLVNLK
jgi:hypothetical protein